MTMKLPCTTCSTKNLAIFKCEGCQDVFCSEHSIEHRNELNQQMSEIFLEHDQLQRCLIESDPSNLIKTIEQWERQSIKTIQRIAQETREKMKRIIESQKEGLAQELKTLSSQVQKAQQQNDFLETDLQKWWTIVRNLKKVFPTNTHPSIIIEEDHQQTLIGNLKIIQNVPLIEDDERFGEISGPIEIVNEGHLARHIGERRGYGLIRGINEYSKGRFKIQFTVNKLHERWAVLFGIFPKALPLPRDASDLRQAGHGWYSDDTTIADRVHLSAPIDYRDLIDQLTLNIELLIDCEEGRLEYYNQQTRQKRTIEVNLQHCPFPWQFLVFLYDVQTNIQIRCAYRFLLS